MTWVEAMIWWVGVACIGGAILGAVSVYAWLCWKFIRSM